MKKIMLSSVAALLIAAVSQAQFKVGLKAGGNLDNQKVNVKEGTIYASDNLKGYHAGLIGELDLGSNFYLQPQLLFSRKGAMHLSSTGAGDTKVRISYVELPVNVLYKLDLPFGKAFAGAGGAFSYGIGGKETQGDVSGKIYSGVKDWRREDISLTFTAGLEFDNGFFASINSQKGLLDIHQSKDVTIRNKSMSVSIGYLIDWNKLRRKA
ncbi:MAG: PorT family protein [Chitinophagaceae bacterium]|nr:PorT family protein [Chitinophagaceae bacterium]